MGILWAGRAKANRGEQPNLPASSGLGDEAARTVNRIPGEPSTTLLCRVPGSGAAVAGAGWGLKAGGTLVWYFDALCKSLHNSNVSRGCRALGVGLWYFL